MTPLDIVRNFVFDFYSADEEMKEAYARYWGPMEQKFGEDVGRVEAALAAFLEAGGIGISTRWDLSRAFQNWWGVPEGDATPQEHANARLEALLDGLSST